MVWTCITPGIHVHRFLPNANNDDNMAGSSEEIENISDLVASRTASNSSLNGPRNLAYAATERANLLNLSKLCIKNLIESSLKLGRSLGEDHLALQQFFVIIEHVLRHGLKGWCIVDYWLYFMQYNLS